MAPPMAPPRGKGALKAQAGLSFTPGVSGDFLQREERLRPDLGQMRRKLGRRQNRKGPPQTRSSFPPARWVQRRELGVHQGPGETYRTSFSGSWGWEAWGRWWSHGGGPAPPQGKGDAGVGWWGTPHWDVDGSAPGEGGGLGGGRSAWGSQHSAPGTPGWGPGLMGWSW